MRPVLALLIFGLFALPTKGQNVRLEDRSDWWSFYNEKEPGMHNLKLAEKRFDRNNFRILGLSLSTLDFRVVAAKLGTAKIVDRGDASYSRSQACYVSADDSDKVYLIFEGGEGGSSTFYLFHAATDWKGSKFCAQSALVSENLATATGLKLGLARDEVEAILGKPDSTEQNRIGYCREFKRRTTREEFQKLRGDDPNLTDKQAHRLYDLIDDSMQVEIHFAEGKATYMYVSTETIED